MADAKARFRIEGEDATGAAFQSVKRGMKSIEGAANSLGRAYSAAFAGISLAAIGSFVNQSIAFGDELQRASVKAGVSAKAISELAFAAKLADVELGSLSTALRFMQKTLSEAASGAKGARDNLAAIGLTFERLAALAPDQQFELIGDQISKLASSADRSRAATELFGRAGAELLPLFEDGAKGIRAAREEAEKFGLSYSEEKLAQLAKADDAIKRLTFSFKGLFSSLTGKIAGPLADTLDGITAFATGGKVLEEYNYRIAAGFLKGGASAISRPQGPADLSKAAGIFAPGTSNPLPPGFTAPTAAAAASSSLARQSAGISEADRVRYDRIDQAVARAKEFSQSVEDSFTDIGKSADEFVERYVDSFKQPFDELSVYATRAAENMQDAFADFLFDPFQDGLKGMLRGFVDVVRRMVAEQAAAQIFGSKESGGSGLGAAISTGIGAFFGGFRAAGGPVSSGRAYVVGEEGPELFMPGKSGTIVPNGASGGGVSITNNIDARGSTPDAVQLLGSMIPAIIEQAVQQSVSRVRDLSSRRGF